MHKDWFYWHGEELFLHIYLQPRASKDEIIGLHDNCLKLRIKAPAIEGRANQYLITFLAQQFSVPEKAVSITQGELSRKKWVKILAPKRMTAIEEFIK